MRHVSLSLSLLALLALGPAGTRVANAQQASPCGAHIQPLELFVQSHTIAEAVRAYDLDGNLIEQFTGVTETPVDGTYADGTCEWAGEADGSGSTSGYPHLVQATPIVIGLSVEPDEESTTSEEILSYYTYLDCDIADTSQSGYGFFCPPWEQDGGDGDYYWTTHGLTHSAYLDVYPNGGLTWGLTSTWIVPYTVGHTPGRRIYEFLTPQDGRIQQDGAIHFTVGTDVVFTIPLLTDPNTGATIPFDWNFSGSPSAVLTFRAGRQLIVEGTLKVSHMTFEGAPGKAGAAWTSRRAAHWRSPAPSRSKTPPATPSRARSS